MRAFLKPANTIKARTMTSVGPTRPFSFNYPCPRKLREIMKMSAIERESSETIEMIWNTYH